MRSIKDPPADLLQGCSDLPNLLPGEDPKEHHIKIVQQYWLTCQRYESLIQSF